MNQSNKVFNERKTRLKSGDNKMKTSGRKIAARALRLRAVFRPHFEKTANADDLAFHLAEIQDELLHLYKLLSRLTEGKAAKKADIGTIHELVGIHWPYHIRAAKRLLDKAKE